MSFVVAHNQITKNNSYTRTFLRVEVRRDRECLSGVEPDPLDHTFTHRHFSKRFIDNIAQWLNTANTYTPIYLCAITIFTNVS